MQARAPWREERTPRFDVDGGTAAAKTAALANGDMLHDQNITRQQCDIVREIEEGGGAGGTPDTGQPGARGTGSRGAAEAGMSVETRKRAHQHERAVGRGT